jgi:predicted murein hydrolase (TIGR00659 family)
MIDFFELVKGQPLFAISITVLAYAVAEAIWRKTGKLALLNPVLLATGGVACLILVSGISYESYLQQAQPINQSLSLLIILLAVPLCRQFWLIKTVGTPIGIALLTGSVIAIITSLLFPVAMGADQSLIATLAPRSVTTGVAVEMSARLGGLPGLTAVIVISTGIFGAAFGPTILETSGVRDDRAIGFALGLAAHGIGTARAFQISETAGAFASLGMILNVLVTLVLVPFVFMML